MPALGLVRILNDTLCLTIKNVEMTLCERERRVLLWNFEYFIYCETFPSCIVETHLLFVELATNK